MKICCTHTGSSFRSQYLILEQIKINCAFHIEICPPLKRKQDIKCVICTLQSIYLQHSQFHLLYLILHFVQHLKFQNIIKLVLLMFIR